MDAGLRILRSTAKRRFSNARLLLGNKSAVGVGWAEYWKAHPDYLQKQWSEIEPLLTTGKLNPLVGVEYPLDQAAKALQLMDDRGAVGKIVLTTGR